MNTRLRFFRFLWFCALSFLLCSCASSQWSRMSESNLRPGEALNRCLVVAERSELVAFRETSVVASMDGINSATRLAEALVEGLTQRGATAKLASKGNQMTAFSYEAFDTVIFVRCTSFNTSGSTPKTYFSVRFFRPHDDRQALQGVLNMSGFMGWEAAARQILDQTLDGDRKLK